jgi:methylated-DNA-protein-cysteine methyltransferase-like protein
VKRVDEAVGAPEGNFYHAVWQIVRLVPRGRVVTYGQIATWLGSPRAARAVGYALLHATDPKLPWHRVINARGQISVGGRLHRPEEQQQRLRRERVRFDAAGRIDLRRYGWQLDPDAAVTRTVLSRLGLL